MNVQKQCSAIPLGEIFRAANGLVAEGLIENWALGGALAGVYYTEPVATYDADIFFIPADKSVSAGIPAIYRHLQAQGWVAEGGHLLVQGFPVQLLGAHGLTEEAVLAAAEIEFEGVAGRVFLAEYIVAIAASVGRAKDRARIEQMLGQAEMDRERLNVILKRHNLNLPKL
jgi:hypothetical protein